MTGVSWRIRPFAAGADRAWVRLLWQAAMPPSWPVLPVGIGQFGEGLVAQAGHVPVGLSGRTRTNIMRVHERGGNHPQRADVACRGSTGCWTGLTWEPLLGRGQLSFAGGGRHVAPRRNAAGFRCGIR